MDRDLRRSPASDCGATYRREDDKYVCDLCDYNSSHLEKVRQHTAAHHRGRVVCLTCNKAFIKVPPCHPHPGVTPPPPEPYASLTLGSPPPPPPPQSPTPPSPQGNPPRALRLPHPRVTPLPQSPTPPSPQGRLPHL